MAGPIVNLMPGYKSCNAGARTWADECQKAFFPSLSFHVYKIKLPSVVKGVTVSIVWLLNFAEITFRAKPSLMSLATSMAVMPALYALTEPSGKVMFIMFFYIYLMVQI